MTVRETTASEDDEVLEELLEEPTKDEGDRMEFDTPLLDFLTK